MATKVGGLLLRRDLLRLRGALDPEEYGGAFLVGMNAPVIIAHGNSKARGIANAVRQGAPRRGQRSAADHRPRAWDARRRSVDSAKLIRRLVDDP